MTTWNLQGLQKHLLICNGSTCMGAGAEEVTLAIRDEIEKHELNEQIHTSRTRCNGRCRDKCIVISYPEGNWYSVPNGAVAREIVTNSIDDEHRIYTFGQNGLQKANNQYSKGISKSKERKKKGVTQAVKKAVLFVGHGSKLESGNEEVRQFIQKTKKLIDSSILVETCFLEFASPNIEEGIELCIEKGAQEVHVIPIILLHAGHSKMHIPAEIEHVREHFPQIEFTYGQTIGIHENIFDILKTRLLEIGFDPEVEHKDTAILLIGRGGSDPDANSDFYKISRLLWEKLNVGWVESAFMGVTTPTIEQGMERCVKLGVKKIIMLPYFLFTGILMERMNIMRNTFTTHYPSVDIQIASYLGYHEKLQHILIERVEQAMNGFSTGMQDLENYRAYAKVHGPLHHHHHH